MSRGRDPLGSGRQAGHTRSLERALSTTRWVLIGLSSSASLLFTRGVLAGYDEEPLFALLALTVFLIVTSIGLVGFSHGEPGRAPGISPDIDADAEPDPNAGLNPGYIDHRNH